MARSHQRYSHKEVLPLVRSLQEAIEKFRHFQHSEGRAIGTLNRYDATFLLFQRFLTDQDLLADQTSLTSESMEQFATWLRDRPIRPQHGSSQRSESGIHAHLRDMRAFTRWLYQRKLIAEEVVCPMPRLPKRLTRVMEPNELDALWQSQYLQGHSHLAIRNRALVSLMLDTGIRRQEAATVKLADLNLASRSLTVIGKGNKERRVFFSKEVSERLKVFLSIRGIDDEPLFHLNASGIRTMFRRIKDELGMEHFHPHLLRHQFATTMLRGGTKLEHISLLLGHEDYNSTRRYLHLDDDDLQAAHEAASPFAGYSDKIVELPRRKKYSRKEPA